jgi:WhiB family redox-sensing transcriptional regulator
VPLRRVAPDEQAGPADCEPERPEGDTALMREPVTVTSRDLLTPPETPRDWTLLADCQYTDPEAFFPEKGGSPREAKRVCRSCEVRAECLEYALENDERHGIWGGLSERERRRITATRRTAA